MLRPWKKSDVNVRRKVWLSVYGVQLHDWKAETFTKLGNRMGKVIEIHKDTVERTGLRQGRVLIETPYFDVIIKESSIMIKGEVFRVHLVEEMFCQGIDDPVHLIRKASRSRIPNNGIRSDSKKSDFYSGRSSDECVDDSDDKDSHWSNDENLLEIGDEFKDFVEAEMWKGEKTAIF